MSETENIKIEENEEHHHHHHHHSHHGHHSHSSGRRHHSREDEVKKRKRDAKWQGVYKPILRILFLGVLLILVILIIWSIFTPNDTMRKATSRDVNTTQKVQEDIEKEELQAEIESLKEELSKYEEKVSYLEELLMSEGIEFDDETEEDSGVDEETENKKSDKD